MSAKFLGEYYERKRSNDFRNRRTGTILRNVRLRKRRGMTNQAIIWDGKNWKGVERSYHHVYSADPKKNISAERAFKKRVMTRQQQKAMFARKRRRR